MAEDFPLILPVQIPVQIYSIKVVPEAAKQLRQWTCDISWQFKSQFSTTVLKRWKKQPSSYGSGLAIDVGSSNPTLELQY